MSTTLFACSRCYSRHPFEELSAGQQLCKACRTSYPIVKCTYCRTEFQQTSLRSTNPTCSKCEQNVKTHGPPQSCCYCNIIAAFIGNKCQRCNNSEKKYGLPVNCGGCKMQCAFERGPGEKVEGKLLCWLCTLSYKRALAKTKSSDKRETREKLKRRHPHSSNPTHNQPHPQNSSSSHRHPHHTHSSHPSTHRPDVTKVTELQGASSPVSKTLKEKLPMEDGQNSDTVGLVTQLREQISSLTRQVGLKEKELLGKEREITDLKANNFRTESELRLKLKSAQRDYETKVQNMTTKLKTLQKELAIKNKSSKKSSLTIISRQQDNSNSPKVEPRGGSGSDDEL